MKLLILGHFNQQTAQAIKQFFPQAWSVTITSPAAAHPFLADAEALIPEHVPVTEELLAQMPHLAMIQTGAGYDNVDLAACQKHHIIVANAAGVNANAVAEHTWALILAWVKNIVYLDNFMKQGRPQSELAYHGYELVGKTLGVVGLGRIGQRVAKIAQVFGMKVLAYNRHPRQIGGVEQVTLPDLLANSDIVSLHIAATSQTKHLINAAALQQMKQTALLVNTARGALVDESALVAALQSKQLSGACLDVFASEPLPADSELRQLPQVILTPHTAGLPDAPGLQAKRYQFFAANLAQYARGGQPEHRLV